MTLARQPPRATIGFLGSNCFTAKYEVNVYLEHLKQTYQKLIRVDAEVRILENCFQTDLSIFAHL